MNRPLGAIYQALNQSSDQDWRLVFYIGKENNATKDPALGESTVVCLQLKV